jgi:VanZ family protein
VAVKLWWLLTASWIAVIWVFSSRPGSEVGLPAPWDKLAHFVTYAVLGFFAARASRRRWTGWLIAALYGAVDEWHQASVPLRDAAMGDWIADALGAFFGSSWAHLSVRRSVRA